MNKLTLALGSTLLVIPALAIALDYSDSAATYTDAPFSRAEQAGISLLTTIGAVSGNPDGSFDADRAVNRAEFLKIAFLSNPDMSVSASDADDCFPDVAASDWFSRYVCLAKTTGAVGGYPDGYFRPGNAVNYVEAIKMLAELYSYALPEPAANERWAWYTAYVRASEDHGVLIPSSLSYDEPLTRGRVARLAAAFRAEHEGELALYRNAELGRSTSSSSVSSSSSVTSATSESSVSSTSSTSSVSSASSSSSTSSASLFPAVSSFLVSGTATAPIADGTFTARDEDAYLRLVEVDLFNSVSAIDRIELINQDGDVLATLALATANNLDESEWEVILTGNDAYKFLADTPVNLGIRAVLKSYADGGASNQLVEVREFRMDVQGAETGKTTNLAAPDLRIPRHQTAYGKVLSVDNVLANSMSLTEGTKKTVASFEVSAEAIDEALVQLDGLTFEMLTSNVTVTNIRIGGSSDLQQSSCSVEISDRTQVNCGNIPEGFRAISNDSVTISMYADISLVNTASSGTVQFRHIGKGEIGQNGTVRWADGTGTFNWVDQYATLSSGPLVTVTVTP